MLSRQHRLGPGPAFPLRAAVTPGQLFAAVSAATGTRPAFDATRDPNTIASRRAASLLRIDARNPFNPGRIFERSALAPVLHNRRALGWRQSKDGGDVRRSREVHVDAAMLARQILDDIHQLGIGALRTASDHRLTVCSH